MRRLALAGLLLLFPLFASAQVEFEEELVAELFDGALNVVAADVNDDGSMDIIGACENGDQFIWWEQTGGEWEEHLLGTMNGATNVAVADLNGDGDLDILGAAYLDHVSWYENEGAEIFTQHILSTYEHNKGIEAWDFDGDGDLDIAATTEGGNEVAWLENTGDPEIWPVHVIWPFESASYLDLDDIDGDGDVDVAVCGRFNGDVAWYENSEGTWIEHMLDSAFGESRSVKVADINGDGLLDILAASRSDFLSWWDQSDWLRHNISSTFDGADDVYPCDIDLDGDMDVVGAAVFSDRVSWFEQNEGVWTEYVIDPANDYVSGVHAADMDGDGDPDVLAAGYYSDTIKLYTQLGSPEPDPVTLTLTPHVETIPPQGGILFYDAHLLSLVGVQYQGVRYWTTVITPDQQEVGPLFTQQFTLQPFMDVTVTNLSQTVPGYVDPGEYAFIGHVGYINNPDLQISDDFSFEKLGAGEDGWVFNPEEWSGTGWEVVSAEANSTELPGQAELVSIYPNPFNAVTKVTVRLAEKAQVELRVLNLLGQEVATLNKGMLASGRHEFKIEGTELSSGIYFLSGRIARQPVAQKLILLR